MDIQFGYLERLYWLWLVGAGTAVAVGGIVFHHRAMRQFASSELLARLIDKRRIRRRFVAAAFSALALTLVVIGLVDVRWGKAEREIPQRGIEVMFVLDVSRSMVAEDVAPNRLARAKQYIRDMVAEMAGDRVGLILFAGNVRQHIPLTNHYDDFRQTLGEVGPHNVERGGSNLGDAIRVATESFLEKTADHKAIVLITDGEDHDSNPAAIAKSSHEDTGVRIFTVGIGDMSEGARIPIQTRGGGSRFVEHKGQQIWSKLDGKILQQIASNSAGAFIPAGTKQVDMGAVYHRFIGNIEQQDFETATVNTYVPRYQWFLWPAFGFVMLELFVSSWRSNQ